MVAALGAVFFFAAACIGSLVFMMLCGMIAYAIFISTYFLAKGSS